MLINLENIQVSKTRRADGRLQARIKRENAPPKYIYGKTEEQLTENITIYANSKEAREPYTPPLIKNNTTFLEWLTKFQETKKQTLKPSSFESLSSAFRTFNKTFGAKKLNSVKEAELEKYFNEYPAKRSRDMQLLYVNQALKAAVKAKLIKANPCADFKKKLHKAKHKRALTITQQKAFTNCIKGRKHEAVLMLLLTTGIRIGEALGLKYEDINYEKKEITINRNCVYIKGKKIIQDENGVKSNFRVIPIPTAALILIPQSDAESFVFSFSYNAVKTALDRIKAKLNIKMSLHSLRHTYATRLIEQGVPLKVIQYLLGHKTLSVTQDIYVEVQPDYINSFKTSIKNAFDTEFDTEKS